MQLTGKTPYNGHYKAGLCRVAPYTKGMNIFVLHTNPFIAAEWHCDKHIVKMPLETAQMLCTVNHRFGAPARYKPCHQRHPCTLWAGETTENYQWLWQLGLALCAEYSYRYGKTHASEAVIRELETPPPGLPVGDLTQFAQAMPDEYKHPTDATVAYQTYYIHAKARIAQWQRNRNAPLFMKTSLTLTPTAPNEMLKS